jgi:serine/threonine protein kinase
VSLVQYIPSGKEMVWKKIDYGKLKDKEIHQLINEVNILRELKHENIVRCYDKIVDKKNTTLYIVMEYCKGGDLAQLIEKCKKKGQTINEVVIWKIMM